MPLLSLLRRSVGFRTSEPRQRLRIGGTGCTLIENPSQFLARLPLQADAAVELRQES